jgi:hypothetical protein
MSDETAREIAERETGRTDDRRETPERRANRSSDGRRKSAAASPRRKGTKPETTGNPAREIQTVHPSGADQRRFNRM